MRPLFEVESAKSKRPAEDDDSFAFEPMNANVRAGEIRRNPSTDEKKARRKHVAAHACYECMVCDREFATQEQADKHEAGNPSHHTRTAGIMDWYDVVVLWSGYEVGLQEAGYAHWADAIAKAEQLAADPKALRVTVMNRNNGDVVWFNGEFRGDWAKGYRGENNEHAAAHRTARLDYFDVEVHFGDGRVSNVAGSADYGEAEIQAALHSRNPSAAKVLVVHREDGAIWWRNGVPTVMAPVLTAASLISRSASTHDAILNHLRRG